MFTDAIADIKALKVHGAQETSLLGIEAFAARANELVDAYPDPLDLIEALKRDKNILITARPSEIMLRNAMRYIFVHEPLLEMSGEQIATEITKRCQEMRNHIILSRDRIAELASRKIKKGSVVFTYADSATVVDCLLYTAKKNKQITVINTECSPRKLGRDTALALSHAGIKVHHLADNALRMAIKRADIVLLGAHAIGHELKTWNTMGSELVAMIAAIYRVPVYVCANSLKYDVIRHKVPIEERLAAELWESAPKNVRVEHLAFEKVDPDLVTGFICELGIYKPEEFRHEMEKEYKDWMKF